MPDFLLNWAAEIQPATLLKKRLRHRCFPVNLWKFLSKSTLQNTSARIPPCFVSFFEILVKKAFRMVLHYFRNSSCKLSLKTVWLSQSLSAYCYVKMQKFVHCHRQRRAPSKRCVPSINKRPPHYCWHIPKILWKQLVYPDYFFLCDYVYIVRFIDLMSPLYLNLV